MCPIIKRRRRWQKIVAIPLAMLLSNVACITIDLPENIDLLAVGTPFVLSGTAALIDNNGPCLVWLGENGITYHLFQDARLDNDLFDEVTEPGTTSRLEIVTRSDLEVVCQVGDVVEVRDVLDIEG